jgi:tetratricopeptide (TPR) repeat protein
MTLKRTAQKPAAAKPSAAKPGAAKPSAAKPVAAKASATPPPAAKLTAAKLNSAKPAAKVPASDPALDLFGRAITATHQQNWREAAALLRRLLAETDDDPALAESARQYLALCEQRLANGKTAGGDDDPYLQAVVAKNRGDFAEALALCRRGGRHRRDERMAYLAASILALEGEFAEAAELLALAVDLNARNRVQAFHDSDFADVLGRAEFAFVLDPS